MEGANESTELWRHPKNCNVCLFEKTKHKREKVARVGPIKKSCSSMLMLK